MSTIEEKRKDFDEVDTDNDGFITGTELKVSLGTNPRISPENIDAIIKVADDNLDKKFSFEEYAALIR